VQPASDEDDTDFNLGFTKFLNIMCMYLYMYLYMIYAWLYIYVHDAPNRSVPLLSLHPSQFCGRVKHYSGGLQGPMLLLPRTAAPAVNNSEEVSCITAEHLELEKVHQEPEPPVVFVHVFVHTMFWVNYSVNLMLYLVWQGKPSLHGLSMGWLMIICPDCWD